MATSAYPIRMKVDNKDDDDHDGAPIFIMNCLSPSRDEVEPPTKIFDRAESPKCGLAFSLDLDDDNDEDDDEDGGRLVEATYDRCPIEQQLKERLAEQKRLDRLIILRKESNISTPGRPTTHTEGLLQIQSCPTSPSFMSRVYTSLAAANNPDSPQLPPHLDPLTYSLSNLMASKDEDHDNDDKVYDYPTSFFCQDEPITTTSKKKSPARSTLIDVLARIGTDYSEDTDDSIVVEDDDDNEDDIHGIAWIPPVRCIPEGTTTKSLLTPLQMHQIARHVLPKGIASSQWKRLYSLVRDGDSFDVCLHYARQDSKTLLVVRTTRGAIFGGYAGDVWAPNGDGYYGRSDACLFTFEEDSSCGVSENVDPQTPQRRRSSSNNNNNNKKKTPKTPLSPPTVHRPKKSLLDDEEHNYEASLPSIRVYRYTGVNRYIQYCDATKKRMAFGGGDGSFGLCVEQEFQQGSTGHCETFDNEPLCDQENFKIVDVELWGFRSMF